MSQTILGMEINGLVARWTCYRATCVEKCLPNHKNQRHPVYHPG